MSSFGVKGPSGTSCLRPNPGSSPRFWSSGSDLCLTEASCLFLWPSFLPPQDLCTSQPCYIECSFFFSFLKVAPAILYMSSISSSEKSIISSKPMSAFLYYILLPERLSKLESVHLLISVIMWSISGAPSRLLTASPREPHLLLLLQCVICARVVPDTLR